LEETWNGGFKDREVAFCRNLHLVFMACKAANISKFAVRSRVVDKRFARMAIMDPDNDNPLPNQVLVGRCLMRLVLVNESVDYHHDSLILDWLDDLCLHYFEDLIHLKRFGYYNRLMRLIYSDMDNDALDEEMINNAWGFVASIRTFCAKHMKAVRGGLVHDHPHTCVRNYPRTMDGEFMAFVPLDTLPIDMLVIPEPTPVTMPGLSTVEPTVVTQTQTDDKESRGLSMDLDPKLVTDLAFQRGEKIGQD
jgi:hypothetical protein